MSTSPQLSVSFPEDQRAVLERLSAQTNRSIASIVRDAVSAYLVQSAGAAGPMPIQPDDLWRILQDPVNWARFKALAAEMEERTASPVFVGGGVPDTYVGESGPTPGYRYERPKGVPPRAAKPTEEPPF